MNDRITYFIRIGFALQQIEQTIFAYISFAIKFITKPAFR